MRLNDCACAGTLEGALHGMTGCMRLGRAEWKAEPQLYAPLRYPPLDTQCTAGPGMRCQCASCRAMRKQLWAVQPEEQHG